MIILSKLIQFYNFTLSLLAVFKFFGNISSSFEFWKFWTHNAKAMTKDKKVNIVVT